MVTKYLLPLVAAGLLIFAVVHVSRGQKPEPPALPPVEPARSAFPNVVAGSGIVEAQTENISVGSPVPGVVVEVFVRVQDQVQAQAPLFRLDDRQLRAEEQVRRAALAAAQAEVDRLAHEPREEDLSIAQAVYREAVADLEWRQDALERTEKLVEQGSRPREQLVVALEAVRMAEARLARSQAELDRTESGAWEYDKQIAQAAVQQAQSALDAVLTDIERLTICALVAGEVLQVNVRPGEFVAAPSSTPLIVLGDVHRLHVRVDIDEHDIPRFDDQGEAVANVRGAAEQRYDLQFVRVEPFVVPKRSLTGDNRERVDTRVLQVIYELAPSEQPLYVGQQMDVFIEVAAEATAPAAGRAALSAGR